MRVKQLRDDPQFPRGLAGEKHIEKTVEEHEQVSEELLIQGIIEFQNFYEDTIREVYLSHETASLRRYVHESTTMSPILETSDYIITLTKEGDNRDSIIEGARNRIRDKLGEHVFFAVLDHHENAVKETLNLEMNEYIQPNESWIPLLLKSPEDEMFEVGFNFSYFYRDSDNILRVDSTWGYRGEAGILRFHQKWDVRLDSISYTLEVENVEATYNHGVAQAYETEGKVEPLEIEPSFKRVNNLLHVEKDDFDILQRQAKATFDIFETFKSKRKEWYDEAVDNALTCDYNGEVQNPSEGRYVITREEENPLSHVARSVCTDCVADFLNHHNILSERQAKVFALQRAGFSHTKIAKEINKNLDESEEITRGAVSGAISQIHDKVDVAESTTKFVGAYTK